MQTMLNLQEGKTIEITESPIDKLAISNLNPRCIRPDYAINDFANSMNENGYDPLKPLRVHELDGKLCIFVSLKPKLRDDAVLCVNVNDLRDKETNVLYPYSLMFVHEMIKNGFHLRDEIIWNKVARPPANSEINLTDYKEYIFVFVLNPETIVDVEAINDEQVTDRGNMWMIAPDDRDDDADIYPFPEKLVEYCLLYGSQKNDLVLDPFLGLGTTCVVCKRMSRRSIGFEKNLELEQIVKKRLDEIEIGSNHVVEQKGE